MSTVPDVERDQIARLAAEAKDRPGALVTGYTDADREFLRRVAAKKRAEADRLEAEASGESVA